MKQMIPSKAICYAIAEVRIIDAKPLASLQVSALAAPEVVLWDPTGSRQLPVQRTEIMACRAGLHREPRAAVRAALEAKSL
jgi:hypothetical protein